MSLAVIFYILAGLLALISAFTGSPRVNLLSLAVAAIAAGLATEILT